MLVKRFYDDGLAQASWLIGCAATGEAIIVDPSRDVDQYISAVAAEGLRLTHVTETHVHADFVSGARELVLRTGAALLLSAEGGVDWQYRYAAADGATLLRDGDTIRVGNIRLDVWHTPGHTPEHVCFIVTDTAGADAPMGMMTGDFVFVGDVGRPDLLEKAAGMTNTMRAAAAQLFRSLQRFRTLPDFMQVWPGHGAGSACGKALGAVPQSTVGYEKLFNPALAIDDEEEFIDFILAGQPEPPRYFAEMKRINRDGPRILGARPQPKCIPDGDLIAALEAGRLVIDTRSRQRYALGHVPGTISIPLNRSFTTWAGWLIPYDADFYLVADAAAVAGRAARELALIGLDRVIGYFRESAIETWQQQQGRPEATQPTIDIPLLGERLAAEPDVAVLDVRGASEWEAGRMAIGNGANGRLQHIPLGQLQDRLDELPRDRPLVVHCASGARSSIAVSLLERHGFANAINLEGGFAAWKKMGMPVVN